MRFLICQNLFQFTPLCERLHIDWSDLGKSIFISIHASLREATIRMPVLTIWCERLRVQFPAYSLASLFQFTPLCERLQRIALLQHSRRFYFNSRLSARGYIQNHSAMSCQKLFQFTPLCERLPVLMEKQISPYRFQFTPLCERLQQKQTIYSCISA